MLTRQTVGNNYYLMSGMELTENSGTITIAAGLLGSFSLDAMSFDLTPDASLPVDYSLYLTLNNGSIVPVLDRTLLDGVTIPAYDGTDRAIHRLIKLILEPDGTYTGTFTQIIVDTGQGGKITS